MKRLFVESDGDRYPKDVYICEDGENDRLCTMDGTNETTMRHKANEICDAVNARAETGDRLQIIRELTIALRESVRLQSHYATLLNQWDGGQRMPFKDSDAWIARLKETKTIQ